jgi:hypothetical protein
VGLLVSELARTAASRDLWSSVDPTLQTGIPRVDTPSGEPGWLPLFLLVCVVNVVVVMFARILVILLN